jgi:hypothetical protein
MHIFARLTKVDEAARTVTGIIANEALDHSGEVFDYESSKPNFEKWSGDIAKATDGKSVGNVRAMHGNVCAGITKSITFDDVAKAIEVEAKIVDDNEWNKTLAGCYTGFSIGGSYARKWKGDDGVQRYTADPVEYSLVDLPCNPDAQFSVIKADGAEEMRKFVTTTDNAEALAKWVEGLNDGERATVLAKIAPPADPVEVVLAEPVTKDYTAQAERLSKADGADDAGNVVRAVLGMETVQKGLWTVANFAEVLSQLACITDGSEDEAAWEGDGSKVPAQLRAALKPLADAFLAMAAEEVAEAIAPASEEVEVMELAAQADDLAKAGKRHSAKDQAAIEALAKSHGLAKKHVDAMGDHLAALQQGAAPAEDDDKAQKLTKAADDLQKVTSERDALTKTVASLTEQYAALLKRAAPAKGVARVVEKTVALGGGNPDDIDDEPVLGKDGSVDHLATAEKLMRKAYRAPRQ